MMTPEAIFIHFRIIGILLIGLSMVHLIFPSYFNWNEDLKNISLINRQMMNIHTFFIALVVLLMGILCLCSTEDLIHTQLGKQVSLGIGIFWFIRMVIQFFGYSSELWKGKVFETVVHVLFSTLWVYLTTMFLLNYFTDVR